MKITIRPVKDVQGADHFKELQRCVWSSPDQDLVPTHVTITVAKNGGMLLGAYADDGPQEIGGMVAIAFWWPGVGTPRGQTEPRIKACSHMVGVLPGWQGYGIGRRLKLAQREAVLAQGLTDWITWTYDPLFLANGIFNMNRLGTTCNTYARDVYGAMRDALNAGVPSDRCQVDWWLNSPHVLHAVERRRSAHDPGWNPATLHVLPSEVRADGFRRPVQAKLVLDGQPLALPIPDDIAAIRARDGELSIAWRLYMRHVLEDAFAANYTMVDCINIPDKGWHYVLVQEYM